MPPYPGQIVFTWFEAGQIDLYTIFPSTFSINRLTEDNEISILPLWSPDGKKIAFISIQPESDTPGLKLVDLEINGEVLTILENLELLDFIFSWGPSGRYLLTTGPQPGGAELDNYRVDNQTGQITNLTADSPVWDAFPSYAPDGSRIVFTPDRALEGGKASDNIWIMNPDGSGLVNLTPNDEFFWEDSHAEWSPDSTQIAFTRFSIFDTPDTPGAPGGIWVVQADGSEERLVFDTESDLTINELVWSPDGTMIAYRNAVLEKEEIWIVEVATGEAWMVAALAELTAGISWSPDSQAITFTNINGNTIQIFVAAADGSGIWSLFESEGNGYAHWGP